METKLIFEAIRELLSNCGASSTVAGGLSQALESNLTSYRTLLKDSRFLDLQRRLDIFKIAPENHLLRYKPENPTLLLYANFTLEAATLISILNDHTCSLNDADKSAAHTKTGVPTAPRALLGVADQRTFHSLLEFVVSLGIFPYLLPGVDGMLRLRLSHATSITKATEVPWDVTTRLLCGTCSVIVKCFHNEVIGATVLTRHLSDILAALIQVCYSPETKPPHSKVTFTSPGDVSALGATISKMSIKDKCREKLEDLLAKTYQPLVVRELLRLPGSGGGAKITRGGRGAKNKDGGGGAQGGARNLKWLHKACLDLLYERLMSKNGVQHVISGIMEMTPGGSLEDPVDWRKCKSIATMLANCPSQGSHKDHYATVSPQLLHLVCTKSVSEHHQRVAIETVALMMSQNKSLSDTYLFQPLTQPILSLVGVTNCYGCTEVRGQEVEACIYNLHQICARVEPSSPLLVALFPVSPILFHMWKADLKNIRLSGCAEELLERVLKTASTSEILSLLCFLCHIPYKEPQQFQTLHPDVRLESAGNPPTLHIKHSPVTCGGMEESRGHGFSSLSLEAVEINSRFIVKLLQSVVKVEDLVGTFFMECFNRLAEVLSLDPNSKEPPQNPNNNTSDSSSHSSALLDCEHVLPMSASEVRDRMATLYITAALCEHLSAEVISQSHLPSLLSVCGKILTHHAAVLERREGERSKGLLLAQQDDYEEEEVVGGPLSMTLVFGLLSAVMAGAREVARADRQYLSAMMPSLQSIATKCADPELCRLAGDLRVCIGTLGAVWSKEMAASSPQTDHDPKLSPFQVALSELKDPLIPVQGHALIALTKLIHSRDLEAQQNVTTLLRIFREYLSHSDSYLYLASINGLVELAVTAPPTSESILSILCREYACLAGKPDPKARSECDRETGLLQGSRPATIKPPKSHDIETRMKLGEALVRVFRELCDVLPHFLSDIVASLLTGVRDLEPLIRASSLSNLAEVCSVGKNVLTSIIIEVLSCVQHILLGDKDAKVRQAALVVLKSIIKGSRSTSLEEASESLLSVYRLLKQVESCEQDELTRAHAQAALGELDSFMRAFLFPDHSDRKMEKKISILSQ